jgi:hypothetical protein
MKNTIKVAIFMMAIMFSASMAFGQEVGENPNYDANQPTHLRVKMIIDTPSMDADYVLITYRFWDGDHDLWGDWGSGYAEFVAGNANYFITDNSFTNCEDVLFQYQLKAYKSVTPPVFIKSTCDTVPVYNGIENIVPVTTWNPSNCFGSTDAQTNDGYLIED